MNSVNKEKVTKRLGIDLVFEDTKDYLEKFVSGNVSIIIADACYNRDLHPKLLRITVGVMYMKL